MPRPNTNEYIDIVGTGVTAICTEKGSVFLIDTCNRHVAERHCWSLHEHGYARAATRLKDGRSKTVYLHRLIRRCPPDRPHVDHANGQAWDCTEGNLRPCTRSENLRNQKLRVSNTTGLKGVGWHGQTGKYRGRIKADGREIHLGLFESPAAADAVVRRARNSLHEEFARHE